MQLCRFLRWKGIHAQDWSSPAELLAVLRRNDVPFSCLHTCQAWGPDDGPAAPERCDASRPCFEASAMSVGPQV